MAVRADLPASPARRPGRLERHRHRLDAHVREYAPHLFVRASSADQEPLAVVAAAPNVAGTKLTCGAVGKCVLFRLYSLPGRAFSNLALVEHHADLRDRAGSLASRPCATTLPFSAALSTSSCLRSRLERRAASPAWPTSHRCVDGHLARTLAELTRRWRAENVHQAVP